MSCHYGYSSFVAAENNGAKDRAMSFGILNNDILYDKYQCQIKEMMAMTYFPCPSPISRREILKVMGPISCALLKWCIIKIRFKIRIRQEVVNENAGILEPNIILCLHPQWYIIDRLGSIVL
jgi:hypothetical protein